MDTWQRPIIAAIETGLSNARSEGLNRIVKHIGRIAFGFRNPTNQRRRIRWALHPPHQAGAIQDQAATPLLILKSRLSTVRSGVIKERWYLPIRESTNFVTSARSD